MYLKRPTMVAAFNLLCVLAVPASSADAQLTAGSTACINNGALTLMNPDALACSGSWTGNDVNQRAAVLSRVGIDFQSFVGPGFWSYVGTTDAGRTSGPFSSVPGTATGALTFDSPITGFFALALKSSTNFSIYLFNGGVAGLSSIDFTTIGTSRNKRGIAQDLSHASLYDFDAATPPPPPPPVVTATPEPGTLVLMLAGLTGLGVVVRRRKT